MWMATNTEETRWILKRWSMKYIPGRKSTPKGWLRGKICFNRMIWSLICQSHMPLILWALGMQNHNLVSRGTFSILVTGIDLFLQIHLFSIRMHQDLLRKKILIILNPKGNKFLQYEKASLWNNLEMRFKLIPVHWCKNPIIMLQISLLRANLL